MQGATNKELLFEECSSMSLHSLCWGSIHCMPLHAWEMHLSAHPIPTTYLTHVAHVLLHVRYIEEDP